MTDARVRVSVVTITYNQEPYVRQALDSFLAQDTEFPIEVVVADDASTDGTAEIVGAYAEKHPDVFKPILRPANVGVQANLRGALEATRGDYIALCEGDDYWTDPRKLSRQVAHLDANPKLSVSFHPVRVEWEDGSRPTENFPDPEDHDSFTLDTLLHRNFIQTNSVMYRRRATYADIPLDVMPLDWFLHILHALEGEIGFLPEVMSVYRRHPGGVWWGSAHNDPDFWAAQGIAQVRFCERLLEMFADDPARRGLVASRARAVVNKLVRTAEERPGSGLDTFPAHAPLATLLELGELVAAASSLERQNRALKGQIASLTELREKNNVRIAEQRELVSELRGRIQRLRDRVRRREQEIEELRGRLLRARARRLVGKLAAWR